MSHESILIQSTTNHAKDSLTPHDGTEGNPTNMLKNKKSSSDKDSEDDFLRVKRNNCPLCKRNFRVFRAKHRCRICGVKVCDECSRSKVMLTQGKKRGSRTCDSCARQHVTRMNDPPSHDAEHLENENPLHRTNGREKKMKKSFANELPTSYLRARHWFSASFLGFFLVLRISFVGKTTSNSISSPYFATFLHNFVTLRVFAVAVGVLIFIDEILRLIASPIAPSRQKIEEDNEVRPASITKEVSSEEEIPVDTEEKTIGECDFSAEVLIAALEVCHKNLDEIPLECYIKVCREITKLINCLGKGISFAASTVAGYISTIENRVATWPSIGGGNDAQNGRTNLKTYTVASSIDREASLGIADVGGKKNPSVCRCLLRLLWFIDFVESLVRCCLIECDRDDVSSGAIKAYEETIGLRHPWIIRKGVMAALSGTPSRSAFLLSLKVKDNEGAISEAIALQLILQAHGLILGIQSKIHEQLEEQKLSNIK